MTPVDQAVLAAAADWLRAGRRVHLVTMLQTWGSSPRPAGSLWARADDGASVGSVSGGCLEAELAQRLQDQPPPEPNAKPSAMRPAILRYGVTAEEARRVGLPCGGRVELLVESLADPEPLALILSALAERRRIARRVDLRNGTAQLLPAERDDAPLQRDLDAVLRVFGPAWRLLLIGDGAIARMAAEMARTLDYEVILCDPRLATPGDDALHGVRLETGMPDDAVRAHASDPRSAVMALAHDPRLDDLALLEALSGDTGYIGALGSRASNAQRRARLAALGVSDERLARLRGPIGLPIGGRTPAEIAVSAIAELIAVRNGAALARREPGPVAASAS